MTDPTFIDLFSGSGGLALGFEQAGFHSVWAVEADKDAAATYGAHFGHDVYVDDIRNVRAIPDVGPIDVVIGGPPCQGFSPLGRFFTREEHRDMNSLWREFMRVVELARPHAFVMENVPQFLKHEEGRKAIETAHRLGYATVEGVLNAVQFGVPQKRRRAFIIGSRAGQPALPPTNGKRLTVRDVIGDLPLEPTGDDWHIGRKPRELSLQRYALIPPGGNRFNLVAARPDLSPPCWIRKTSGSTDVFGRLEWDEPALTIRNEFFKPEKGRYLHPEADRPITHREAMRLQTFPDDFQWSGSRQSVARQVGNAVPPRLGYHVAMAVRRSLPGSAASPEQR